MAGGQVKGLDHEALPKAGCHGWRFDLMICLKGSRGFQSSYSITSVKGDNAIFR